QPSGYGYASSGRASLAPFVRESLRRRAGADRYAHEWASLRFLVLGNPLGDEFGVVFHPANQPRAARVLPGEAEQVEPRDIGHAATVAQPTVLVEDRKLDPRILRPVARRPDDGVYLQLAAVPEAHRAALSITRARPH